MRTLDAARLYKILIDLGSMSMYQCFTLIYVLLDVGCGTVFSTDGNWKLCYPVCMYRVSKEVSGFDGKLGDVDTCPTSPLAGKGLL